MTLIHDLDLLPKVRNPQFRRDWKAIDRNGWGAVTHDNTLILPGVRSPAEFFGVVRDIRAPGTPRDWHGAALKHAARLQPFLDGYPIRRIIGHSLGGAAAQVLAVRARLPATTFASFRIYRGTGGFPAEARIVNYVRADDIAEGYPPGTRYRRLGQDNVFAPGETQSNGSHGLIHYRRVLGRARRGALPRVRSA